MHGFQLWANLPSSLKMTAPRYQDIPAADIPEVTDDDGTQRARHHRRLLGQDAARSKASPPTRAISTSSCRRASARPCRSKSAATPSPMCSKAPARSRGASQPFGVLTEKETTAGETLVREQTGNRSLVLFDSGDEVTVQAGERRHPLPAGVRQADRGAGRLVRPDRDEHASRAAAGGDASCATARSSSTAD